MNDGSVTYIEKDVFRNSDNKNYRAIVKNMKMSHGQ